MLKLRCIFSGISNNSIHSILRAVNISKTPSASMQFRPREVAKYRTRLDFKITSISLDLLNSREINFFGSISVIDDWNSLKPRQELHN
jgi:hypothetical protein